MKILFVLLCIAGVALCVVGAMGHIAAFPGAALCFFPAVLIVMASGKKDDNAAPADSHGRRAVVW